MENVEHPEQYVAAALKKCKTRHILRTYNVEPFSTTLEFLEILARKGGRLLKGGEADVDGVAKMVLNDFLRGKIPWFVPPPQAEGLGDGDEEGHKDRSGDVARLNKIPTADLRKSKRKRDDADLEDGREAPDNGSDGSDDSSEADFDSFSDDDEEEEGDEEEESTDGDAANFSDEVKSNDLQKADQERAGLSITDPTNAQVA